MPTPSHPLPAVKLYFLKVPEPSQTASLVGEEDFFNTQACSGHSTTFKPQQRARMTSV